MIGFFRRSDPRAARRGRVAAQRLADELEGRIQTATRQRIAELTQLVHALPEAWEYQAHEDFAFLLEAGRLKAALRRCRYAPDAAASDNPLLAYAISTLFLHDCFAYLVGDEQGRERLHLVTGPITVEGVRVPSRIEKVPLQDQSAGYAAADPLATSRQIDTLAERDGHALLCLFHSHITRGLESTTPSQIDLNTQDRFAAVGCDAIGGIFSLDGFVRLFSTANDFTVHLSGNRAQFVATAPRETIIKLAVEP
jgi:hypothetical protein